LIKYFLVQVISSVLIIFRVVGLIGSSGVLLFYLKMGAPPLHFWVFGLLLFLEELVFVIVLGVQKLMLLLFRGFLDVGGKFLFFVIFSFCVGLFLLKINRLFFLVFCLSFIHLGWMLLILGVSLKFVFFYWGFYF